METHIQKTTARHVDPLRLQASRRLAAMDLVRSNGVAIEVPDRLDGPGLAQDTY